MMVNGSGVILDITDRNGPVNCSGLGLGHNFWLWWLLFLMIIFNPVLQFERINDTVRPGCRTMT